MTPEEEGDCFELLRSGVQRELRLKAGETLNSLATELGIPRQTLARYEHGSYPTKADVRERYYRKLREWTG